MSFALLRPFERLKFSSALNEWAEKWKFIVKGSEAKDLHNLKVFLAKLFSRSTRDFPENITKTASSALFLIGVERNSS